MISLFLTELGEDNSLNMAAKELSDLSSGETFTLDQFQYPNSVVADRMFEHLSTSNFLGITVSDR